MASEHNAIERVVESSANTFSTRLRFFLSAPVAMITSTVSDVGLASMRGWRTSRVMRW